MFTSFYSLSGKPFGKEIKAKDMFHSSAQVELLARLNYLKDNRGMASVIGEAGQG